MIRSNKELQKKLVQAREQRYPNGYMGKIQYWTGKLKDEVMNTKVPSLEHIDRIHRKLDYFIQKEFNRTITLK